MKKSLQIVLIFFITIPTVYGQLKLVDKVTDGDLTLPHSAAVSPDNNYIYVASFEGFINIYKKEPSGELSFVDAFKDKDKLNGANSLIVSPDGNFLYACAVNTGNVDGKLVLFDINKTDGKITYKDIIENIHEPNSLHFSQDKDGKYLILVEVKGNNILIYERDLSSGKLSIKNTIGGFKFPRELIISPDDKHLYVTEAGNKSVTLVNKNADWSAASFVKRYDAGGNDASSDQLGPFGVDISKDGKFVFVGNRNDFSLLSYSRSPSSGELIQKDIVEHKTNDNLDRIRKVLVSPISNQNFVYVSAESSNRVSVYTYDDNGNFSLEQVVIQTMNRPIDMAISSDNKYLYTCAFSEGALFVFAIPEPLVNDPSVSSITPNQGTIGTEVTISGEYFGTDKGKVSFGNIIIEGNAITEWTRTSIKTSVPAGISGSVEVKIITSDSKEAVAPEKFKVISAINEIVNPAAKIGDEVTISGSGFGSAGQVNVGSVTVSSDQDGVVWSQTSIKLKVPDGLSSNVSVTVEVDGNKSAGKTLAIIPEITNLDKTSGLPGNEVTLTGNGFGSTQGSSVVKFGSRTALIKSGSWSQKEIVAIVPINLEGEVDVSVKVGNQTGVFPTKFKVTLSPSISDFDPKSGSPGSKFTVSGNNFGILNGELLFGSLNASIETWTNTSISGIIPNEAFGDQPITVKTTSGLSANSGAVLYSVIPLIDEGNSELEDKIGDDVTIVGKGFGNTTGIVSFGNSPATINNWSNTSINVTVPTGIHNDVSLKVEASNAKSDAVTFGVVPEITGIKPAEVHEGQQVSVEGSGFGPVAEQGQLQLAGSNITPNSWADNNISFTVPEGTTLGNIEIKVISNNGKEDANADLKIIAKPVTGPEITAIDPGKGKNGSLVKIMGKRFGTDKATVKVSFGETEANIENITDNEIQVKIPENISGNIEVTVEKGGESSKGAFSIIPTINSLNLLKGKPGDMVIVSGKAFGPAAGSNGFVKFGDSNAEIADGGWWETEVKVIVPDIPEGVVNIVVSAFNGETDTLPNGFTVEAKDTIIIPPGENPIINFTPNGLVNNGLNSLAVSATFEENTTISELKLMYSGIQFPDKSASKTFTVAPAKGLVNETFEDLPFDQDGIGIKVQLSYSANGKNFTTDPIPVYKNFPDGITKDATEFIYGTKEDDYQIIAFPLNRPNHQSVTVALEDDLKAYDNTLWRLWHYNNGNNIEFKTGFTTLEQGKGYWLIMRHADSVFRSTKSIDTGEGTTELPNDEPFTISLKQGWNLIGNPYTFDVNWTDIVNFNPGFSSSENLKVFNRGFKDGDVLKAFEGGFVFSDGSFELKIPIEQNIPSGGRMAKGLVEKNAIDQESWKVDLSLTAGEIKNSIGALGMHPYAELSKDRYDQMALPRFLSYLETNFSHPEYFFPRFAQDIVSTSEGHTWEFSVNTNHELSPTIEMNWDNSYFGDNDKSLILVDLASGKVIDMRKNTQHTYPNSPERKFKIYFGDQDYISDNLNMGEVALGNAYPNPLEVSTNIPFVLPGAQEEFHVTLTIYDHLGREVNMLIDQKFKSGFYETTWSGDGTNGSKVSHGLYIYQLKVSGQNIEKIYTRKMLVK
ncbi:IPT/TIG domain-containing protein [Flexithrix dorotheae]|uniref:IPT/TIG domain-containing protein n=1 Tax=Flexithrix dorotheae TaxID=70993 RepID=UPI0003779E0A|nr:IPT/TIG domain-containing protein [Flexithrix dorotheae]